MIRRETRRATAYGFRVGAALAASLLVAPSALAQPLQTQTVVEIRVHGNQSMTSDEVTALAGVAVGDRLAVSEVVSIEDRLYASGRFDSVEVRARYRSLTVTDEVVLVVVVSERAGATSTSPVARLLGPLGRRMLFLPVLDYTEGYGVTYGGRVGVVDVAGTHGRLSVPATWGGRKQIGVELDRAFDEGETRLHGGGALTRQRNPGFDVDDDRATLWVAAERRIPGHLQLQGRVEWGDVEFGARTDTRASYRVSLELDTRRNVAFPRDAVFAQVGFEWLDMSSGVRVVGRPTYEVQAYKGVIGQTVLAARARFIGADGPLPPFEKPLFGGGTAVRGWEVGSFIGDRLLVASAEIRMPFTSPFSIGEAGLKTFYDTGAVFDATQSVGDARFRHGAGIGVFFKPPFADVGVDVAHNLVDRVRVHVVAALSF